jgi:hypothetical protein
MVVFLFSSSMKTSRHLAATNRLERNLVGHLISNTGQLEMAVLDARSCVDERHGGVRVRAGLTSSIVAETTALSTIAAIFVLLKTLTSFSSPQFEVRFLSSRLFS